MWLIIVIITLIVAEIASHRNAEWTLWWGAFPDSKAELYDLNPPRANRSARTSRKALNVSLLFGKDENGDARKSNPLMNPLPSTLFHVCMTENKRMLKRNANLSLCRENLFIFGAHFYSPSHFALKGRTAIRSGFINGVICVLFFCRRGTCKHNCFWGVRAQRFALGFKSQQLWWESLSRYKERGVHCYVSGRGDFLVVQGVGPARI